MRKQQNNAAHDEQGEHARDEVVVWQYSGRTGGWWAYQTDHKEAIEKGYQLFMDSLDKMKNAGRGTGAQQNEKVDGDIDEDAGGKYDLGKQETTQSLSKEKGLDEHQVAIEIGMRSYVVDFAQMIQFDEEYPSRTRKIKRTTQSKHKLERRDSLKGCAGKFFEKDKDDESCGPP